MKMSLQRLGDNPKDHDGTFKGFDSEGDGDIGGVSGARPDAYAKLQKNKQATSTSQFMTDVNATPSQFIPWRIYPKPPPPHWHWKDKEAALAAGLPPEEQFEFAKCIIPGKQAIGPNQTVRTFRLDDTGVFQVYSDSLEEGDGGFYESLAIFRL